MSVKIPKVYVEMYCGSMNVEQVERIVSVKNTKEIPALKDKIFKFSTDLIIRAAQECTSIRKIMSKEKTDYTEYIGELRWYQTVGTAFMYMSKRSILADWCGTGKTAEVAALFNLLRERKEMSRFLMAVENSAIGQMQYELIKMTGLNVVQLPSEKHKMIRAIDNMDWNNVDGIVIKHSALRSDTFSGWLSKNLKEDGTNRVFDCFVLDESSVIKSLDTKLALYTRNICNICNRVHFLNATAFENCLKDIYSQVDILDETVLPLMSAVEKQFCTFGTTSYWAKSNGSACQKYAKELTGYKNQDIFKQRLGLVYFGRSKKDIGLEAESEYKVFEIEPNIAQLAAIGRGYRYMEVLNCPSLIPELGLPTERKSVPKLDRLCQTVEEMSGAKGMIYCFHIEAQNKIADELRKQGRNVLILNGASTDEERLEIQKQFNHGDCEIVVTNVKKSLNLYGGDFCIFYSVETNPSKMFQIASRIDRNIDDRKKTFILMLYKDTDEQRFFMDVVSRRAQDSRDLTIDAKSTVDFFMEAME